MGIYGEGEFVLTFAAVSELFIKNIESVQSYLEAMIGDEDVDVMRDEELLRSRREKLEKRIVKFSPPRMPDVRPEEGEMWIENIEKCIEKAKNPEIQPIEAIPWF
ncbi:hypothetical protein GPJ56_006885 [Histomonas meleagridis]|uniref:uncharacterized protein n=1 Tax=Histomonas meleagridis TaxID=135588 RepID=UPI003559CA94|nr:hypothetical protein GPJ56_006885 [Histomonas meleagridis]KAH0802374.1 hypothetical protein GO595_004987 [Histomonas meleagridis]